MNRVEANYVVAMAMAVTFFLLFVTGIIKFPGLLRQLLGDLYFSIPFYAVNLIHDWSGIIFGSLAVVHIIINWRFLSAMTRRYLRKGGDS